MTVNHGWLAISALLCGSATVVFSACLPACLDWFTARFLDTQFARAKALELPEPSYRQVLRWWLFAIIAAVMVPWLMLGMLPIGIAAGVVVFFLPGQRYVIRRREQQLRDSLSAAANRVRDANRASLNLAQALRYAAERSPASCPMRDVLGRIVAENRNGATLEEALRRTRDRLNLEPFTLFASALQVCLLRGGDLQKTLDRIITSIDRHQSLELKIRTDTATGRRVVWLLAAFPLVFLSLAYSVDPVTMSVLFNDTVGNIVLGFTIAMMYAGIRWATKLTELKY
jgi:Flp pilus assembly protein TadB